MPKGSGRRPDAKARRGGFFSGRRAYLLAFFAYMIIAFVVFYPAMVHPLINVPGGAVPDVYESVWDVWRVGYSVFALHQGMWYTNLVFAPTGASMVFETGVPIMDLLVYPITSVSLPLAYNLIFCFGMIFSGLAMMLLVDYLLDNKYAGFIAGIMFAFGAFHIAAAYQNLQWSNIGWVPLSIYLFLRILDKRYWKIRYGRYLNVTALSASFVLMFYAGDVEQVLMTLLVLLIILLSYLVTRKRRAMVVNREFISLMALSVLLFLIFGSWALVPLISGFSGGGGTGALNRANNVVSNMLWSDNLLSYVTPSHYNGLFNRLGRWSLPYDYAWSSDTAYIGFTVLVLAALGVYGYRKSLYLWVVVGAVFFLFSLGPYLQVGSANTGIPGPYLLLKYVPVLELIREPGKFALVISLAFAVMAAYGIKFISEKIRLLGKRQAIKLGVFAVISVMILAESATPPLSAAFASQVSTNLRVSNFYVSLGTQKGSFAILELPMLLDYDTGFGAFYSGKAELTTIYSDKPVVGGYINRETVQGEDSVYAIPLTTQAIELETTGNPFYSSPINENYTNQTVLFIHLDNISFVTVDKTAFNPYSLASMENYMEHVFGNPVYQDGGIIAYSTANAVARSPYHGFVGYAEFAYWNMTFYNGKSFWIPKGNGTMEVYAPYSQANGSVISGQNVDTVVDLTAVSIGHATAVLRVSENISDGVSEVASFNLTGTPEDYRFEVMLAPGAQGNRLHFTPGGNYQVGVSNVSFSLSDGNAGGG